MCRERYYRYLFLAGALWNWLAAVVLWFGYEPLLKYLGMSPLNYALPMQMALALIFVYGVAYFYVSRDHTKNREIAKLGVYGKTAVFILLVSTWRAGDIAFFLVIPGIVDLVFAALFLEFLVATSQFSLSDKLQSLPSYHEIISHVRTAMAHKGVH